MYVVGDDNDTKTRKNILQSSFNMRNGVLETHKYSHQRMICIKSKRIEIYSYIIRHVLRSQALVQLFLSIIKIDEMCLDFRRWAVFPGYKQVSPFYPIQSKPSRNLYAFRIISLHVKYTIYTIYKKKGLIFSTCAHLKSFTILPLQHFWNSNAEQYKWAWYVLWCTICYFFFMS